MEYLIGFLALGTIGFVAVFAIISKRAADTRRKSDVEKSALSEDGIRERLQSRNG